jgi:alkaline phosphatase D
MYFLDKLNRKSSTISRRQLLHRASVLASAAMLPSVLSVAVHAQASLTENPFKLGVASGDPLSDGFVIWTRLALYPTEIDYGMRSEAMLVSWEVSETENMSRIVQGGSAIARPELGHSVHVELRGLRAGREYWYRFSFGDYTSRVGRGITTPTIGNSLQEFKFAYVSCQHYERGYFPAYRDLVAQDPQFIVHLGDYIYENDPNRFIVRRHEGPEPVTLQQYRARYSLYRMDADLQSAHAHTSWAFTWDDHEVDNNYANDQSQDFDDPSEFLTRRAAAYQAYYEMMPLRASSRPQAANLRLYQRIVFGDLIAFNILDNRQYRSDHPCDWSGRGPNVVPQLCSELTDPNRTMLGRAQENWLAQNLANREARWNVIAQQTLFAEFNRGSNGNTVYSTDGWGGYPVSRDRIVEQMLNANTSNPIIIGGDMHAYWVTDIKQDWNNPNSRTIASEFVGTSITSGGGLNAQYTELIKQNPHVKLIETEQRGYVLCTVTPQTWRVDHRCIEDAGILSPDSQLATARSFIVENGRPGAIRV